LSQAGRRLFASFRDPETQDRLALALPAFRDKAALVQFGGWDPMKQQGWYERWAREVPDSEVRILPHVAHFPFEGGPQATVSNFREWWAAVDQRQRSSRALRVVPVFSAPIA
jgi:pimeloyl-ACP methyl ester carboxylesterase